MISPRIVKLNKIHIKNNSFWQYKHYFLSFNCIKVAAVQHNIVIVIWCYVFSWFCKVFSCFERLRSMCVMGFSSYSTTSFYPLSRFIHITDDYSLTFSLCQDSVNVWKSSLQYLCKRISDIVAFIFQKMELHMVYRVKSPKYYNII